MYYRGIYGVFIEDEKCNAVVELHVILYNNSKIWFKMSGWGQSSWWAPVPWPMTNKTLYYRGIYGVFIEDEKCNAVVELHVILYNNSNIWFKMSGWGQSSWWAPVPWPMTNKTLYYRGIYGVFIEDEKCNAVVELHVILYNNSNIWFKMSGWGQSSWWAPVPWPMTNKTLYYRGIYGVFIEIKNVMLL